MFERFTDQTRQVLVLAHNEARLLSHGFIGTEHLLLGVLHEGEGVAAKALESLGMTLEGARAKVEQAVGPATGPMTGSAPFTPRAKKVLELSFRECVERGDSHIGTEHLLLGLIREGEGVGVRVLIASGINLSDVRQRVLELAGKVPASSSRPRGPVRTLDPSVAAGVVRASSANPPDCPHCRASLDAAVRYHHAKVNDDEVNDDEVNDDEGEHTLLVVYCGECGRALAFRPVE
jgi:ATP-dependent Clp protease ATP-binding subunit ClpA